LYSSKQIIFPFHKTPLTRIELVIKVVEPSPIEMFIVDMYGRVIEKRILSNAQTIYMGEKYRPGTYIVRIIQGDQSKQLKLIKLPE
jgi:hypothetical protein